MLLCCFTGRYTVPSRTTFRKKIIPKAYYDASLTLRQIILEHFKHETFSMLSITTDGWTSKCLTSYVTYTLHLINSDFDMANYTIATLEFRESHTAENLQNHLIAILKKWGIIECNCNSQLQEVMPISSGCENEVDVCIGGEATDGDDSEEEELVASDVEMTDHKDLLSTNALSSLCCDCRDIPGNLKISVTTDNASNVSKAVHDSGFRHVRCFAHTVNLAVQKGIATLDAQVCKVRRVVNLFHKSSKATSLLQVQLNF